MDALVIVLAAVVIIAAVVCVEMRLRVSGSRKLIEEYEAQEDVLQEKIADLMSGKSALETRLSTMNEYAGVLSASHEKALSEQKASYEKALSAQKEAFERELAAQKEAGARLLKQQQENNERTLKTQEEQQKKNLEAMENAFKALSAQNSEIFKTRSAESIAEILRPVQEKFSEFDRSVRESQKDSAARSAELKTHIETVLKQSQVVGEEAKNLANAIVGHSKVQGDFGEMLLTDVLNSAGLVEGIHYSTQSVITDSDGREIKTREGRTMIPDVMVYYPDGTTVIVDSKVSLKAYREYTVAQTADERRSFAKEHVESIRRHIDELKTKDYASYIPQGKRKVGYNLMFVPVEGAFRLMLEESPVLWQLAKDSNVLVVSQMTLVIVLNMIQMAWKQESQEKNIAEVYRTAEELMSQLNGWMASYVSVGAFLEKTRQAYAESTRKLKDSNQSVVRKIRKLEGLGLAPRKSQAKLRPGARLSVPASIVPKELACGDDDQDTDAGDPTGDLIP